MTNELILDAIGMINEEAVREARAYQSAKPRRPMKWVAVAACLCLFAAVFAMLPYENWLNHRADDPDWHKTHFETAVLSEIEAVCGTQLLLDKIAPPGEYHSEYILEIAEGGDFHSAEAWHNLSVQISSGKNAADAEADNIFCFISFDGGTEAINLPLWQGGAATELNGHTLMSDERTTEDYAAEGVTPGGKLNYHGHAVFEYGGYTYYLATNSDEPDFYEATLRRMLAE